MRFLSALIGMPRLVTVGYPRAGELVLLSCCSCFLACFLVEDLASPVYVRQIFHNSKECHTKISAE